MLSFSQVKSAGSAGNYYTEKDNYYVTGSMEERWQGKGAETLELEGKVDKQVFTALLENGASEQGARMSAMDNATRNAGDMINRLTIQYNRSRQAAITKELIEIISGAEAL